MNEVTDLLGTLQTRAYRVLRNSSYGILERYGLTPTHWAVISAIDEASDKGIKAVDIAADMHVKAPLVTMITHDLILRDFVVSTPHRYDGRAKVLKITLEGAALISKVETELRVLLKKLLYGLTDKDIATYYKVLETIILNNDHV